MSEEKKKRQKRSVYLVIEKPREFKTKKEAEQYLAERSSPDQTANVSVYQAKRVEFNVVKMIHIG